MPDNDSSPKQATPRKAAKYVTPVKKKLTRKRKATPETWKKNVRKRLRLTGKEYKRALGPWVAHLRMTDQWSGTIVKFW